MKDRMVGNIVAQTDGKAFVITKSAFIKALHLDEHNKNDGFLQQIAKRRIHRIQLQQISIFRDSMLDTIQINGLLDAMHHCQYEQDEIIVTTGEKIEPAMYFVREGAVVLETMKGSEQQIIEKGGYFGEKNMLLDQNKDNNQRPRVKRSLMKIISAEAQTKVDILYLEEARKIVDTTKIGLGVKSEVSAIDESVQWDHIERRVILGAGSFGQVWLATIPATSMSNMNGEAKDLDDGRRVVALKIIDKHKLLQSSEQAERVVAEKNIMASLRSPFIIRLYQTFQDDHRLYMVTSLVQGGELQSIIPEEGLSENATKFYGAGVLEALKFMHQKHIIHRDIKATNILIDSNGYPVLIDMGFAKYVPDKTFTFCGSPMLTAPEIIRYTGHDKACDYWSWAVLCFFMVTAKYPFYERGASEAALYKRICRGEFELSGNMSVAFKSLMVALLHPEPTHRLGSKANGWKELFAHAWFERDEKFDLQRARNRTFPAPWVPQLKDSYDASRFRHNPAANSSTETIFDQCLSSDQQQVFAPFGSFINASGSW